MATVVPETKDRVSTSDPPPITKEFIVSELLPIFNKHHGTIFGGCVRDLFVREVKLTGDIDVYFSSKVYINECLNELRELTVNRIPETFTPAEVCWYPYAHMFFEAEFKSGHKVGLDFTVAPFIPVNDFDVNQVILNKHGEPSHDYIHTGLLANIKAGRARVLRSYSFFIEDTIRAFPEKKSTILLVMIEHRFQHMKDKGFTFEIPPSIENLLMEHGPKKYPHEDVGIEYIIKSLLKVLNREQLLKVQTLVEERLKAIDVAEPSP